MTAPVTDTQLASLVAAERREMAAVLSDLPEESWNAPTLCAGWRVREVVAHMEMLYRYSPARFLAELARSGGRFHRMADRRARQDGLASPHELVSVMAAAADSARTPPGVGLEGALIHDVIHGLDVTVPLGLGRRVPAETLRIVLAGVTKPKSLKHFGAELDGVELRAEDLDWSFGSGTPVSGAAQDLTLVVCGRRFPAGRLRGGASARFTDS
ncbi:MAG: maleylpyruvate isomerase family mycothiol-dependent enzyme [Jatrophihabitantaceae bacterium]